MRKITRGPLFQGLREANRLAARSARGLYAASILLGFFASAQLFLGLYYTEYSVNGMMQIASGTAEFRSVAEKIGTLGGCTMLLLLADMARDILWNRLSLRMKAVYYEELLHTVSYLRADCFEDHEGNLKIYEVCEKGFEANLDLVKSTMLYIRSVPMVLVCLYYLTQIHIAIVVLYFVLFLCLSKYTQEAFSDLGGLWEEIQPYSHKQQYFFSLMSEKTSHQEGKLYRLYTYLFRKWERAYEEEKRIEIQIFKKFEIRMQTARLILNLPYLVMMIFVSYEIVLGRHTVGFLFLMGQLLDRLLGMIEEIQENAAQNMTSLKFVEKGKEVKQMPVIKMKSGGDSTEMEQRKETAYALQLNAVHYTYPQAKRPALNGVCFDVKKGEKIAVVGVNGSGKTTCMKLISGLLSGYTGELKADSCGPGRSRIACIPQDFAQYQLTIHENIQAGCIERTLSDEELEKILRKAGMLEFVQSLEHGVDTLLGQLDGGKELSLGQWQRLAVARLLADQEADLWILDEPTAYLDPLSEIEMYRMINQIGADRTILFISHRLGYVRNADRILVFDQGQVVEDGRHAELMEAQGIYASMYQAQEKWYR